MKTLPSGSTNSAGSEISCSSSELWFRATLGTLHACRSRQERRDTLSRGHGSSSSSESGSDTAGRQHATGHASRLGHNARQRDRRAAGSARQPISLSSSPGSSSDKEQHQPTATTATGKKAAVAVPSSRRAWDSSDDDSAEAGAGDDAAAGGGEMGGGSDAADGLQTSMHVGVVNSRAGTVRSDKAGRAEQQQDSQLAPTTDATGNVSFNAACHPAVHNSGAICITASVWLAPGRSNSVAHSDLHPATDVFHSGLRATEKCSRRPS